MRVAAMLVLAVALLPALASAKDGGAHVEFSTPAQLEGHVETANATWALLVFHDATATAFTVESAGGSLFNHTKGRLRTDHDGVSETDTPILGPPAAAQAVEASRFALGFNGWSSLYIEGKGLQIVLDGAGATLNVIEAGANGAGFLPRVVYESSSFRPDAFPAEARGAVAGFAPLGDQMPFRVSATRVERLEWHNATLSCQAGGCPDAGRSTVVSLPPDELRVLSYLELQGAATVEGQGVAVLVAGGGPRPDLATTGHLRLPDASLTGTCGDDECPDPDGRTLTLDGSVLLARLEPAGQARLQANAAGNLDAATFDEQPVPLVVLGAAAAAGALVVVALFFAVKAAVKAALAALFAREPPSLGLKHPRARVVYALIRDNPGLSFRELMRKTEFSGRSVKHHVEKMVAAKQVSVHRHKNTLRYFIAKTATPDWETQVVLTDGALRSLHDWLAKNPGVKQADVVVHATDEWGWTRTSTRRRLERLVEVQLLDVKKTGRVLSYVAEPLPGS